MAATIRVLIVGGGLAGLACARRLRRSGATVTVLEASDDVGGCVRTDQVEGYRLDRGFQVLLTGYPEATQALDYAALRLQPFHPGAIVRHAGGFHRISDPFRRPQDLLHTLSSPVGSLRDKLAVLRLRRDALNGGLCARAGGAATPVRDVLRTYGFSVEMQQRFFRPFLGGVFMEDALSAPCHLFSFLRASFSRGAIALPTEGMGAVAHQVAAGLPPESIRLHARVRELDGTGVVLDSGERLAGDAVVLATESSVAARLCGEAASGESGRNAFSLYFEAPLSPMAGSWLVVNGDEQGPIRTLCVLSEVAPSYAPPGRSLVSVSLSQQAATVGDETLKALWRQLREWFGDAVDGWRHLRTDRIVRALPPMAVLSAHTEPSALRLRPGLYRCGDYLGTGTLDAALLTGRVAAETLLADRDLS